MSFTEKRLCNPTQLTTSGQTLYTVPASKTAIIKQIVVTNVTGSVVTFSLFIGSAATPNALFSGTSVAANDTVIINLSQVLSQNEILTSLASANSSLNITISGVENDGPLNPLSTYIADGAITTAKLADSSVTTAKIAAGAVAESDIASNAVTQAKLASGLSGATIVTSSTLSSLIPSPFTGQICYETDTGYLRVWDGSAWDYFSPKQDTIPGAYQSYTPTWTSLTVGNGTQAFSYTQINKMVHVFGRITFGSTTSISSTPLFTLPVNRADANLAVLGTATLGDSGTGTYVGYPLSTAANNCYMFRMDHTVGATVLEGAMTATSPFTWVTNDFIQINLMYPGV